MNSSYFECGQYNECAQKFSWSSNIVFAIPTKIAHYYANSASIKILHLNLHGAPVRLNIVYDILQTTKLSSSTLDRKSNSVLRYTNHIYFVICNSCYWCASYFNIDDLESSSQVLRCHLCKSHNTELIPISSNESFRVEYNVTRGMVMEFYRSNDIVERQESPEQQIVPLV